MLEVMNLVLELAQKGVQFVFIRQPELTTFNSPCMILYDMEYKQIEYYIKEKKLNIRATWLLLDEKGTYAVSIIFARKKGLVENNK